MDRPKDKVFVVSAVRFRLAPVVGMISDDFMFRACDGPKLPAMQTIAVPEVEKGIKIIIGDDIAFPGFTENREHNEKDFVPEQTILEAAVKRSDGRVVFV